MKALIQKTAAIALVAMLAIALVLTPTTASARYKSHWDDLPGSDIDYTPYLIVGGVVLAGLIIFAVAQHHSEPVADTAGVSGDPATVSADSAVELRSLHQKPASAQPADSNTVTSPAPKRESRLNLYIGLTNDKAIYRSDEPAMNLSDYSVRVGVTIGF